MLALTKIAETSSTITLGWTPVPGCLGYVLYVDGARKSNSWDPAKSTWKTSKGSVYRVVSLGVAEEGIYPLVTPPPPPPSGNRLTRLTLSTPETIVITDANRNAALSLSVGKDYVLDVRPGIDGLVPIKGGRNINVICSGDFAITNTRGSAFWDHGGICVYPGDANSTVHIENARVLGPTVHDAITWACPDRHVRIQTALLKNTPWTQQNLGPGYHADGVQSQGAVKSVEIDRVTIYTCLQGTFFGDHDGVIGPTRMSRVNMVGVPVGKYLFWKSNPDAAPVVIEDCWLDAPKHGSPSIGMWVYPNELGEDGGAGFRVTKCRVSADGQFVDFPGTCIVGGFHKGLPVSGDFVT
jgi:hypothetical protein